MVITIIILIILATITINFAFGENGLITRAQWAQEQYEIEQVREKLEMAKGSAFADGKGKIDPDHYFDILEQEEIIGSKENDVKDNGDGTYDVTTNEGYIFEITLVPSAENPEDLEIEYVGKGDVTGPRITSFTSTASTTNSISVAVEGRNLEGAEYTYSYKKSSEEGEDAWTEFETSENSTCTISGLETGVVYDIKVVVTTSEGTAEKELSEITGELKDADINMDNIVWQGDGTAKVTITANVELEGYKLQYQKNGTSGSWTEITNGTQVPVELNDEIYARIYDGTNTLADGYRKISDNKNPTVSVTKTGEATSNSIAVSVTATDAESGMKEGTTYTYYIKESSQTDTEYVAKATDIPDTSYTFTELKQNTNYDIKVEVNGDRAGNKGEDTLLNQQTKEVAGASEGLREGSIVATAPSWSNGQASITLTTDTSLQIQYQVGGTTGTWTIIDSGGRATGLNHNDTVYARLWDGTNAGASASVEIRDTIAPTINSVTTSNITSNSITVTVDAVDNESGLATSDTYKYYLNNGSAITSTENSYTFNNLTAETMYTIKVEVFDKAENADDDSTTVSTIAPPIYSSEEIKENAQEFYGAEVIGYSTNHSETSEAVITWRIFYADESNIYLIADDYIASTYAPKGKGGSSVYVNFTDYKLSFNNIVNDYAGASAISTSNPARKWLDTYLNSYRSSTNNNMKAVAYLMDTSKWSSYAGSQAEYAIGGPTLELFCASYQDTHPSRYLQCDSVNSIGYYVKWSDEADSEYDYDVSGLTQNDYNEIYIKSDTSKASGMWLASPSAVEGIRYYWLQFVLCEIQR